MDDTRTPDLFDDDNDENIAPIESHASQAYLSYAVSTVKASAIMRTRRPEFVGIFMSHPLPRHGRSGRRARGGV